MLFGTLVMVTGPTVITPLLRRIKVKERVATVLEAEGILVDAIGAIVAAAVSSLFAQELDEEGVAGGDELRAMVFLVIAVTVVVQGLTGGPVASWLGLLRPSNTGYVILGANDLAQAMGRRCATAARR